MGVSKIPEHGETQDQAHDPEEPSHVVISCRARRRGIDVEFTDPPCDETEGPATFSPEHPLS
jgi:hypothetical protein